ncbi:MAG: phosphoadenylyl-sulfate reductase [Bacteroidota bacterium]|nr:phosphoadenylyl-sulfate reductase [Bacteroidota bacterium]
MSATVNELKTTIDALNERFEKSTPEEVLTYFLQEYRGRIALSSSLGAEDQVLTHLAWLVDPKVRIFTLDTGRLFSETYDLIDATNKLFDIKIDVFFPETKSVEKMVASKGINLFYDSIESRKECCHVRKLEPLKRAFADLDVWICGLRKDQSITRFYSKLVEWDEANGLIKINPLINWTEKQVWAYIREHNIPYNALHDKGFPSIGCQPCTRAVTPGDDIRSGRWWWEEPEHKECGLHSRRQAL